MAKTIALEADADKNVRSMWKSDSLNWSLMIRGLATLESVKAEPKMVPETKALLLLKDIVMLRLGRSNLCDAIAQSLAFE